MKKLEQPAYDLDTIEHDFEYIANKLGILTSELRSYFSAPNKSFRDYKNQEAIYNAGSIFMRMLKLELGGKR